MNPDNGKAIIWLELNEKIGRRSAGAYKKIKYVIAKIFKNLLDLPILVLPQVLFVN